jgi:LmbE family N-acetylglucosaminyl deacetylase
MLESLKNKNILVLAAHPDDEVLGCGATISKLSSLGNKVELITFTDGISSRIKGDRTSDVEKSAKILGIRTFHTGLFPDNAMDSVSLLSLCRFIEKNIEYTPDVIFTHHGGCLNVDHKMVYNATMTVFRPQVGHKTSIYSYYVPSSTNYNPLNNFVGNTYFEVSDFVEIKMSCLREVYYSEMREYPHARSYENIRNLMKVWGSEVGLKYAEKYQLIRGIS